MASAWAASSFSWAKAAFALAAGRAFDSGYRPVNVSLPREIGVTLRYRFGGALSEPEAAPAAYTPPPPVPVAQAAPPVAATISSPIRMAAAADTGSIKSIRADEAVFMD